MRPEDKEYFERRARQERKLALRSADLTVACAHTAMAEEYERRVRSATTVVAALAPESERPSL